MIASCSNRLLAPAAIFVASVFLASIALAGGETEEYAKGEIPCVHQVESGETLSSISKKYLGNAGRWQEIAQMNPHIADPNKIVAGMTVELPCPKKTVAETTAALPMVSMVPAAPTGPTTALRGGRSKRVYHITERQYSFILPKQYPSVGTIISEWDKRALFGQADEIYLDVGEEDDIELRKGDLFTIYQDTEIVQHPKTGLTLGYLNRILGMLEITRVDKQSSVAQITACFADIHPGDKLRAYIPLNLDVEVKENVRKAEASVVGSSDEDFDLTDRRSFFIDKGSAEGIEQGNILSVYRAGERMRDPRKSGYVALPREFIGSAIVFRAEEHTSTAWIFDCIRHFQVGDVAAME